MEGPVQTQCTWADVDFYVTHTSQYLDAESMKRPLKVTVYLCTHDPKLEILIEFIFNKYLCQIEFAIN